MAVAHSTIPGNKANSLNEPQHDKTNKMTGAPSEDQPGKSDQSLPCPHEEALGPLPATERTAKTDQTGWMLSLRWAHTIFLVCHAQAQWQTTMFETNRNTVKTKYERACTCTHVLLT